MPSHQSARGKHRNDDAAGYAKPQNRLTRSSKAQTKPHQNHASPVHSETSPKPLNPRRTLFTIGHGTRLLEDLVSILQTAQVRHLIDVRSFPSSHKNPQFNRDALAVSSELQEAHIKYTWMGELIGGRRNSKQPGLERHTALRVAAFRNYAGYMDTDNFKQGLNELKQVASEEKVAIMCSETLWWRCHRRMISDVLVTQGWEVFHLGIKKGGEVAPHTLWNTARVEADGSLVYDNMEA